MIFSGYSNYMSSQRIMYLYLPLSFLSSSIRPTARMSVSNISINLFFSQPLFSAHVQTISVWTFQEKSRNRLNLAALLIYSLPFKSILVNKWKSKHLKSATSSPVMLFRLCYHHQTIQDEWSQKPFLCHFPFLVLEFHCSYIQPYTTSASSFSSLSSAIFPYLSLSNHPFSFAFLHLLPCYTHLFSHLDLTLIFARPLQLG